jgi:hypothetical protein
LTENCEAALIIVKFSTSHVAHEAFALTWHQGKIAGEKSLATHWIYI